MSISCSRAACTIVVIYCAVLIIRPGVTASVRDLKSSTKPIDSRFQRTGLTAKLFQALQRSTPPSDEKMISGKVERLLVDQRRKKRIGRQNRMWKSTHVNLAKYNRIIPKISSKRRTPPIGLENTEDEKKIKRSISAKYWKNKVNRSDFGNFENTNSLKIVRKSRKRRRSKRSRNRSGNHRHNSTIGDRMFGIDAAVNKTIGILLPMQQDVTISDDNFNSWNYTDPPLPTFNRMKQIYDNDQNIDIPRMEDMADETITHDTFISANKATTIRANRDGETEGNVVLITPRPMRNSRNHFGMVATNRVQLIRKREAMPAVALQTVQINVPANATAFNMGVPLTVAHQDVTVTLTNGHRAQDLDQQQEDTTSIISDDCLPNNANTDFGMHPAGRNYQTQNVSLDCWTPVDPACFIDFTDMSTTESCTTSEVGLGETRFPAETPIGPSDNIYSIDTETYPPTRFCSTISFFSVCGPASGCMKNDNDTETSDHQDLSTEPVCVLMDTSPVVTERLTQEAITNRVTATAEKTNLRPQDNAASFSLDSNNMNFNEQEQLRIYKYSKPQYSNQVSTEPPNTINQQLTVSVTLPALKSAITTGIEAPTVSAAPPGEAKEPSLTVSQLPPPKPQENTTVIASPRPPATANQQFAPSSSQLALIVNPAALSSSEANPPAVNPPLVNQSAEIAQPAALSQSPPIDKPSPLKSEPIASSQSPENQSITTNATPPIAAQSIAPPSNLSSNQVTSLNQSINEPIVVSSQTQPAPLNITAMKSAPQTSLVEAVEETSFPAEWFYVQSRADEMDRAIVNEKYRRGNVSTLYGKSPRSDDSTTKGGSSTIVVGSSNDNLPEVGIVEFLPYADDNARSNFLFPNAVAPQVPREVATYRAEDVMPEEEYEVANENPSEQLNVKRRDVEKVDASAVRDSLSKLNSELFANDNLLAILNLLKREVATISTTPHTTPTSTVAQSLTTGVLTPSSSSISTAHFCETSNADALIVPTSVSYYKSNENGSTSPSGVIPAYSYPDFSFDDNAISVVRRDVETTCCVTDPTTPECVSESTTCPTTEPPGTMDCFIATTTTTTTTPPGTVMTPGSPTAAAAPVAGMAPGAVPPNESAAAFGASSAIYGGGNVIPFMQNGTPCEIPCNMSDTLSEILHNVEMLTEQKLGGAEDFACNVNGTWNSETAGVTFDIIAADGKVQSISMTPADCTRQKGFMSNSTWHLSAVLPIPHSGIIIVNGINEKDKTVVSFIGEYKRYQKKEIIWGHWLINEKCGNGTEGIFAEKSVFDALEKVISGDKNITKSTNTTTPTTNSQNTTESSSTVKLTSTIKSVEIDSTTCKSKDSSTKKSRRKFFRVFGGSIGNKTTTITTESVVSSADNADYENLKTDVITELSTCNETAPADGDATTYNTAILIDNATVSTNLISSSTMILLSMVSGNDIASTSTPMPITISMGTLTNGIVGNATSNGATTSGMAPPSNLTTTTQTSTTSTSNTTISSIVTTAPTTTITTSTALKSTLNVTNFISTVALRSPRTLSPQKAEVIKSYIEPSAAFGVDKNFSMERYRTGDLFDLCNEFLKDARVASTPPYPPPMKKTMTTSWRLGKVAMESAKKTSSVEELLYPKEESTDILFPDESATICDENETEPTTSFSSQKTDQITSTSTTKYVTSKHTIATANVPLKSDSTKVGTTNGMRLQNGANASCTKSSTQPIPYIAGSSPAEVGGNQMLHPPNDQQYNETSTISNDECIIDIHIITIGENVPITVEVENFTANTARSLYTLLRSSPYSSGIRPNKSGTFEKIAVFSQKQFQSISNTTEFPEALQVLPQSETATLYSLLMDSMISNQLDKTTAGTITNEPPVVIGDWHLDLSNITGSYQFPATVLDQPCIVDVRLLFTSLINTTTSQAVTPETTTDLSPISATTCEPITMPQTSLETTTTFSAPESTSIVALEKQSTEELYVSLPNASCEGHIQTQSTETNALPSVSLSSLTVTTDAIDACVLNILLDAGLAPSPTNTSCTLRLPQSLQDLLRTNGMDLPNRDAVQYAQVTNIPQTPSNIPISDVQQIPFLLPTEPYLNANGYQYPQTPVVTTITDSIEEGVMNVLHGNDEELFRQVCKTTDAYGLTIMSYLPTVPSIRTSAVEIPIVLEITTPATQLEQSLTTSNAVLGAPPEMTTLATSEVCIINIVQDTINAQLITTTITTTTQSPDRINYFKDPASVNGNGAIYPTDFVQASLPQSQVSTEPLPETPTTTPDDTCLLNVQLIGLSEVKDSTSQETTSCAVETTTTCNQTVVAATVNFEGPKPTEPYPTKLVMPQQIPSIVAGIPNILNLPNIAGSHAFQAANVASYPSSNINVTNANDANGFNIQPGKITPDSICIQNYLKASTSTIMNLPKFTLNFSFPYKPLNFSQITPTHNLNISQILSHSDDLTFHNTGLAKADDLCLLHVQLESMDTQTATTNFKNQESTIVRLLQPILTTPPPPQNFYASTLTSAQQPLPVDIPSNMLSNQTDQIANGQLFEHLQSPQYGRNLNGLKDFGQQPLLTTPEMQKKLSQTTNNQLPTNLQPLQNGINVNGLQNQQFVTNPQLLQNGLQAIIPTPKQIQNGFSVPLTTCKTIIPQTTLQPPPQQQFQTSTVSPTISSSCVPSMQFANLISANLAYTPSISSTDANEQMKGPNIASTAVVGNNSYCHLVILNITQTATNRTNVRTAANDSSVSPLNAAQWMEQQLQTTPPPQILNQPSMNTIAYKDKTILWDVGAQAITTPFPSSTQDFFWNLGAQQTLNQTSTIITTGPDSTCDQPTLNQQLQTTYPLQTSSTYRTATMQFLNLVSANLPAAPFISSTDANQQMKGPNIASAAVVGNDSYCHLVIFNITQTATNRPNVSITANDSSASPLNAAQWMEQQLQTTSSQQILNQTSMNTTAYKDQTIRWDVGAQAITAPFPNSTKDFFWNLDPQQILNQTFTTITTGPDSTCDQPTSNQQLQNTYPLQTSSTYRTASKQFLNLVSANLPVAPFISSTDANDQMKGPSIASAAVVGNNSYCHLVIFNITQTASSRTNVSITANDSNAWPVNAAQWMEQQLQTTPSPQILNQPSMNTIAYKDKTIPWDVGAQAITTPVPSSTQDFFWNLGAQQILNQTFTNITTSPDSTCDQSTLNQQLQSTYPLQTSSTYRTDSMQFLNLVSADLPAVPFISSTDANEQMKGPNIPNTTVVEDNSYCHLVILNITQTATNRTNVSIAANDSSVSPLNAAQWMEQQLQTTPPPQIFNQTSMNTTAYKDKTILSDVGAQATTAPFPSSTKDFLWNLDAQQTLNQTLTNITTGPDSTCDQQFQSTYPLQTSSTCQTVNAQIGSVDIATNENSADAQQLQTTTIDTLVTFRQGDESSLLTTQSEIIATPTTITATFLDSTTSSPTTMLQIAITTTTTELPATYITPLQNIVNYFATTQICPTFTDTTFYGASQTALPSSIPNATTLPTATALITNVTTTGSLVKSDTTLYGASQTALPSSIPSVTLLPTATVLITNATTTGSLLNLIQMRLNQTFPDLFVASTTVPIQRSTQSRVAGKILTGSTKPNISKSGRKNFCNMVIQRIPLRRNLTEPSLNITTCSTQAANSLRNYQKITKTGQNAQGNGAYSCIHPTVRMMGMTIFPHYLTQVTTATNKSAMGLRPTFATRNGTFSTRRTSGRISTVKALPGKSMQFPSAAFFQKFLEVLQPVKSQSGAASQGRYVSSTCTPAATRRNTTNVIIPMITETIFSTTTILIPTSATCTSAIFTNATPITTTSTITVATTTTPCPTTTPTTTPCPTTTTITTPCPTTTTTTTLTTTTPTITTPSPTIISTITTTLTTTTIALSTAISSTMTVPITTTTLTTSAPICVFPETTMPQITAAPTYILPVTTISPPTATTPIFVLSTITPTTIALIVQYFETATPPTIITPYMFPTTTVGPATIITGFVLPITTITPETTTIMLPITTPATAIGTAYAATPVVSALNILGPIESSEFTATTQTTTQPTVVTTATTPLVLTVKTEQTCPVLNPSFFQFLLECANYSMYNTASLDGFTTSMLPTTVTPPHETVIDQIITIIPYTTAHPGLSLMNGLETAVPQYLNVPLQQLPPQVIIGHEEPTTFSSTLRTTYQQVPQIAQPIVPAPPVYPGQTGYFQPLPPGLLYQPGAPMIPNQVGQPGVSEIQLSTCTSLVPPSPPLAQPTTNGLPILPIQPNYVGETIAPVWPPQLVFPNQQSIPYQTMVPVQPDLLGQPGIPDQPGPSCQTIPPECFVSQQYLPQLTVMPGQPLLPPTQPDISKQTGQKAIQPERGGLVTPAAGLTYPTSFCQLIQPTAVVYPTDAFGNLLSIPQNHPMPPMYPAETPFEVTTHQGGGTALLPQPQHPYPMMTTMKMKSMCDILDMSTRKVIIHDPLREPEYFTTTDIDVYSYMEGQFATTECMPRTTTRNPLFEFFHMNDAQPESECEINFMDDPNVLYAGILNAVANKTGTASSCFFDLPTGSSLSPPFNLASAPSEDVIFATAISFTVGNGIVATADNGSIAIVNSSIYESITEAPFTINIWLEPTDLSVILPTATSQPLMATTSESQTTEYITITEDFTLALPFIATLPHCHLITENCKADTFETTTTSEEGSPSPQSDSVLELLSALSVGSEEPAESTCEMISPAKTTKREPTTCSTAAFSSTPSTCGTTTTTFSAGDNSTECTTESKSKKARSKTEAIKSASGFSVSGAAGSPASATAKTSTTSSKATTCKGTRNQKKRGGTTGTASNSTSTLEFFPDLEMMISDLLYTTDLAADVDEDATASTRRK